MDILNSTWLIKMLSKANATPQGRMLSLFDILDDWLNAPQLNSAIAQQKLLSNNEGKPLLIAYLTEQAIACGAANPAILAEHLMLIARNAAQQSIQDPNCDSLAHGKKAAAALILAQTPTTWAPLSLLNKSLNYGIAASLIFFLGATILISQALIQNHRHQFNIAKTSHPQLAKPMTADYKPKTSLTADDAAAIYAKYEQMRNGTCQFPEALQIPDKDKAVYLDNVVGGKLPSDVGDLAIAKFYLEKVRCNYTPMLMAHSK
ncbi:MAG: hypothetical protein D4R39_04145 [Methylophilaceae bacterium]|nr:MAG: hypothetical protein D4R39_04145 [Methylophilaceae bacterium]